MSRKERKSLFTQTQQLIKAYTRTFKKPPASIPTEGRYTLLSLSTGLSLTLGEYLSERAMDMLQPYLSEDGKHYHFPWLDALKLYPDLSFTALHSDLASALKAPVVSNFTSAIGIEPDGQTMENFMDDTEDEALYDSEGINLPYNEESAEWEFILSQLRQGLPSLDDIGTIDVTLRMYGRSLQLSVMAGQRPIEIGPEWMLQVGSFSHVGIPLWIWQLHHALPYLQELISDESTRLQAYGYLQRVQEFVLSRTPQHTLTLDASQLNEQRFLGISHFQVAVVKSNFGNTADVIPYSDEIIKQLGLSEEEFKRIIQKALSDWNGQEILILQDINNNFVHASLMLTKTQQEALKYLKASLFRKPLQEIKQFVYFPTQTAKGESFQRTFQLDLSEYGPRVTGIGPIIHVPAAFAKSNYASILDRIGIDEIYNDDDGSTTQAIPTPVCQLTYAEGDESRTKPLVELILPAANHNSEDDLRVRLPLDELDRTLGDMKAKIQDESDESPMHTITDVITKEPIDLPLTPAFVDAVNGKVREIRRVLQKTSNSQESAEQLQERNLYVQVAQNVTEPLYQERSEVGAAQELFDLVEKWIEDVPRLKPNVTLFDYQKEGVLWLTHAFMKGYPGVLFADDMGLGKTLQSLCFLSILIDKAWRTRHERSESILYTSDTFDSKNYCPHPVLVVVPPVLMKNFKKQAADFFNEPELSFPMLLLHAEHGISPQQFYINPVHTGRETEDAAPRLNRDELKRHRIIITTYDYVVTYQHSFSQIQWSVLLCDEVQKAKSIRSKVSSALKAIASKTCFKIMMTGTPVENDMVDLYNIMDIATPGQLAPTLKDFRQTYAPLFNLGLSDDETLASDQIEKAMVSLKNRLGFGDIRNGYLLGRLKEEVGSGLPRKFDGAAQEIVTIIPYEEYCAVRGQDLHPLQLLQELKRYSLHPFHRQGYNPNQVVSWVEQSPRFRAVLQKLEEIRDKGTGDKALLFCEYHAFQEALQQTINHKFNLPRNLKAVNSQLVKKDAVIEAFQQYEGFCALVLSPKCAGMGLNLQEASHVFHISRWWNPAVEDQATCRAYRTGQKKDVYVYYCLSRLDDAPNGEKTFDEALHELLSEKRQKRTDLLSPGYAQNISESVLANKMKMQFKETIDTIDSLGEVGALGKSFEKWVKEKLEMEHYRVERVQQDTGIDFIAYPLDQGEPIGIQVKHSSSSASKTSLSEIRRFPTDLQKHNLRLGLFITNKNVSAGHREDLESSEVLEIKMLDRKDLTNFLSSSESLGTFVSRVFS
jgi:SNF2 family DNA or RNA helicase